jgi:hypothetical protein
VQFTVEDATKDPARTKATIGQYQVIIHDVPDKMAPPSSVSASDGKATMSLSPTTANGKTVDDYQIRDNKGKVYPARLGSNTVTGLTNGTSYTFQAQAHNADGWGAWSDASQAVTPYGTPSGVSGANMSANGDAPNSFHLSWNKVSDTGGGSVTYHWSFSGGGSGTTSGTSATTKSVGAGNYSFSVYATNDHSGSKGGSDSASGTMQNPQPSVSLSPGASTGVIDGCSTGRCHYYIVDAKNFPANSTITVNLYCPDELNSHTYTTDGNGSFHLNTESSQYKTFCGFSARATVNGVSSPSMDFGN